jgi:hypothetical protein
VANAMYLFCIMVERASGFPEGAFIVSEKIGI